MSENDIRDFINAQVKLLNNPLLLDDELSNICKEAGVAEGTMRSILFKCNLQMKRHTRSQYESEKVQHAVNEILQNSKEAQSSSEDPVLKLARLLQPLNKQDAEQLTLEERARVVDEIAVLLEKVKDFVRRDQNEDSFGNRLSLNESSDETTAKREVQMEYEQLRSVYLEQNEEIQYHIQKLKYLAKLGGALELLAAHRSSAQTNDDDIEQLRAEMRRFSVLIEKLRFSMRPE